MTHIFYRMKIIDKPKWLDKPHCSSNFAENRISFYNVSKLILETIAQYSVFIENILVVFVSCICTKPFFLYVSIRFIVLYSPQATT